MAVAFFQTSDHDDFDEEDEAPSTPPIHFTADQVKEILQHITSRVDVSGAIDKLRGSTNDDISSSLSLPQQDTPPLSPRLARARFGYSQVTVLA